jgi:hypothetical protein
VVHVDAQAGERAFGQESAQACGLRRREIRRCVFVNSAADGAGSQLGHPAAERLQRTQLQPIPRGEGAGHAEPGNQFVHLLDQACAAVAAMRAIRERGDECLADGVVEQSGQSFGALAFVRLGARVARFQESACELDGERACLLLVALA